MKNFQWLVLAAVGFFLAGASGEEDPAPTSMEGLLTVTEAYEQAQVNMGEVYRKLMTALTPVGKERLKKAQTAWLQYRESQSGFMCFHLAGGPYERMEYYAQLRKETDRRAIDLKKTYDWVCQRSISEQQ